MIDIKKVILLIVLFFTFSVQAKEVVRMHKYYKLDKVYGDYVSSGTLDYPYLDEDDYIFSDYYYSSEYPLGENVEVVTMTNYEYRRTKNIKYINIQNNSNDIHIDKIEVKYDGELLDYECDELTDSFVLQKRKSITLKLDKEYDQMRMTVRIVSDANYNLIYFTTLDDESEQAIFRTEIGSDYTWNACEGTYYVYSQWVDDVYPNKLLNSRIAQFKGEVISYKYRYKLFHSYNLIRNYYDEYLSEPFGDYIYRDDDLYRDYIIGDLIQYKDDYIQDEKDDNAQDEVIDYFDYEVISVPNTGL